ncbi:hypothetical protein [Streptomyces sp. NBC_01579]|uniref:hypothetical protein n=1 Tax=Streptomyces sp. NBC_01579 TaxID=2975885 RepID=UPI003869DCD9
MAEDFSRRGRPCDDVLYQYNEVTGGHGTLNSMAYDIDGGNNRNVCQSPNAPRDVRLRAGSPGLGTGIPVADGITRDYFGNRIPTPPNLDADQDRQPLARTRITPATRPPVPVPTRHPGPALPEARVPPVG